MQKDQREAISAQRTQSGNFNAQEELVSIKPLKKWKQFVSKETINSANSNNNCPNKLINIAQMNDSLDRFIQTEDDRSKSQNKKVALDDLEQIQARMKNDDNWRKMRYLFAKPLFNDLNDYSSAHLLDGERKK
jgi:hypothetical protein